MTSYNRIAEGVKADLTRELGQEIHIDLFRIEMVPTSSNAVVPKQKEYFDMVMTSARSLRAFLNTSLDHGREMAQTGFALSEKTPQELARLISENFSLDELKLVCFDIDLDPEQVPGDTKDAKIIGLIGSCKRRGLLAALILSCQRHRPNATWPA